MRKRGFTVCIAATILFLSQVVAFGKNEPPIKRKGSQLSDRIVNALDSLAKLNVFILQNSSSYPVTPSYHIPELAIEYKLTAMGNTMPIDMDYTPDVQRYISLFTGERREAFSKMLGLAQLYFPIFEEHLDKYRLPLELKYLAIVESALNPLAVSSSGAVGLWQFKINTGEMLNLSVTSYVDERMDPYKSTEAACKYLEYLYRIFKDWHLTLAAYNGGPGAVRNAILRSGGETSYWKLLPYLPEQTRNYVPAYIAATFVAKNYADFEMEPIQPLYNQSKVDTIQVYGGFYLEGINKYTELDLDAIRFLNPSFRTGFVPDDGGFYTITLPHATIKKFFTNVKNIYEYKPKAAGYSITMKNAGDNAGKKKITYTVRSGDYYHRLALTFGCTVDDINAWNPDADDLTVGQRLDIWTDSTTAQQYSKAVELPKNKVN